MRGDSPRHQPVDGPCGEHGRQCPQCGKLIPIEELYCECQTSRYCGDNPCAEVPITGLKYDNGKRQWSLLPWSAVEQVVEILEYGLEKYKSRDSWKTVHDKERRYWEAAQRHLLACHADVNARDDESTLLHAAHLACNALFLVWAAMEKDKEEVPVRGTFW